MILAFYTVQYLYKWLLENCSYKNSVENIKADYFICTYTF